jgi:hypothetical protein
MHEMRGTLPLRQVGLVFQQLNDQTSGSGDLQMVIFAIFHG